MNRLLVGALLAVLLGTPARAGDDALGLYQAGKYQQAIAAASAEDGAPGFTLASRAALADAVVRAPCLDCLKRAEALARKAVARDPNLADAHVYLAVSLGYQARITGPVKARLAGDAEQAKSHLDIALAREPQNAWALAALGGWNIEIVRNGGAALAGWLYGANVAAGLDCFARAFRSAPDNIVLRYQYALSLGGYDLSAHRGEIADALARAGSGPAATAYEMFAQARARELLAALKKDDRAAFALLLRRDQGYP